MLLEKTDGLSEHIFTLLCELCGIHPNFHERQLHLEEYVAMQVWPLIGNIDKQLVVQQKPLLSRQERVDYDS